MEHEQKFASCARDIDAALQYGYSRKLQHKVKIIQIQQLLTFLIFFLGNCIVSHNIFLSQVYSRQGRAFLKLKQVMKREIIIIIAKIQQTRLVNSQHAKAKKAFQLEWDMIGKSDLETK